MCVSNGTHVERPLCDCEWRDASCSFVSENVFSSSELNSNSIKTGIYSMKIFDIGHYELNEHL